MDLIKPEYTKVPIDIFIYKNEIPQIATFVIPKSKDMLESRQADIAEYFRMQEVAEILETRTPRAIIFMNIAPPPATPGEPATANNFVPSLRPVKHGQSSVASRGDDPRGAYNEWTSGLDKRLGNSLRTTIFRFVAEMLTAVGSGEELMSVVEKISVLKVDAAWHAVVILDDAPEVVPPLEERADRWVEDDTEEYVVFEGGTEDGNIDYEDPRNPSLDPQLERDESVSTRYDPEESLPSAVRPAFSHSVDPGSVHDAKAALINYRGE